MNKIILKLGIGRIFPMSFILFCSLFMSENAFSQQSWHRENMQVTYNHGKRFISFYFLFYDYKFGTDKQHAYLHNLKISYFEEGKGNRSLMRATTRKQDQSKGWSWILFSEKKAGTIIEFLNSSNLKTGGVWTDDFEDLSVEVKNTNKRVKKKQDWLRTSRAYVRINWILPESCNPIKNIRIKGEWNVVNGNHDIIDEVYTFDKVMLNKPKMENITSESKSVISSRVKVTGETDAIVVKGAKPGENIQVYNALGQRLNR